MQAKKPKSIETDDFKSAKWDEITKGRKFKDEDVPVLSLLCQWYKIVEQAQGELDKYGSKTAYTNDMGDLKAYPQITTLKTASAEIRQLNKQLGICDSVENDEPRKNVTKLEIIQNKRKKKAHDKVLKSA